MQVQPIKYCEICGKKISDMNRDDWFSHIRIKYCDECRIDVKKQQSAARLKKYRERKRELDIIRDAKLRNLELENEILRQKIEQLWEKRNV